MTMFLQHMKALSDTNHLMNQWKQNHEVLPVYMYITKSITEPSTPRPKPFPLIHTPTDTPTLSF